MLWGIVRKVLFWFDAEAVHRFAVRLILFFSHVGGRRVLRVASGASALPAASHKVWDLEFRSRLGLAAGFDKDAELVSVLPELGFGFAEIGTVVPRPQGGNPRPRLFRDREAGAIFNRMGFNSLGASLTAHRLERALPYLPPGFVVGVNVGKNKDTPAEDAADDYARATESFKGLAGYLVINVSSPNTPGLRALQTWDALKLIVERVQGVISGWKRTPPLLLKLAPELTREDLAALVPRCEVAGVQGWVLTNTLAGKRKVDGKELDGGVSGAPLTARSLEVLKTARSLTQKPIISVGGIMSPADARARIEAGADLVQIYTGWIYGGPGFPASVAADLTRGRKP